MTYNYHETHDDYKGFILRRDNVTVTVDCYMQSLRPNFGADYTCHFSAQYNSHSKAVV